MGNENALVKVTMYGSDFTQDTSDQLSQCLPNIKILITTKEPSMFRNPDQRVIAHHTNTSSMNFVRFKNLKKLAVDINHFISAYENIGNVFIHLIYGKEEKGKKDEACYELVPTKDAYKKYTVYPITSDIIQQQQQQHEKDSHLIKMHFYNRLEELLISDYIESDFTRVYAKFTNGVLQSTNQREGLEWLDTNPH